MPEKFKFNYNTSKLACSVFDILKPVIIIFAVMSIIFTCFVREANVIGNSMLDTLHDGDRVLISSFMYTPKPGYIVAINAENLIEKRIIKRVIAVEGQTIKIDYETGAVYVDGILTEEKYIFSQTRRSNNEYKFPYVIPKGYIFVMGDNRGVSLDSRDATIGLIPYDDIIGKAQLVFFPFNRIKYLY